MREAFPWFGAVTCYKPAGAQVNDSAADNEAQLLSGKKNTVTVNGKEIVKKQPKKRKDPVGEKVSDPIAKLGFGIVAYVDMLWALIWTFTLYSALLIPTFMFFSGGAAYDNAKGASMYLDTYLGNLGYSSVECAQIPASVNSLAISCPYGQIGEILSYGVNPDADNRYLCKSDTASDACKPDRSDISNALDSFLGKEDGSLTWTGSLYNNPSAMPRQCTASSAILFVQFTCEQPEDTLATKYEQMALAVSTGVLIVLLFTISTRMMYQGGKIKQLDWDVATVTAGDYSVEFPIDSEKYAQWKANVYNGPNGGFENGVAPALALKEHMAREIESQLDDFVNNNEWVRKEVYGKQWESKVYGGTKIADIVFSFNNSRLIKALRARGGSIAA